MSDSKKIVIFLSVVFTLLALIPILGNSLVKDTLDAKLQKLESQGIEVIKNEQERGYLETSNHYEFLVKDSKTFMNYLQKYSADQLPSYTKAFIGGTKVGVDLTYSNIPFSKAVSVDIYPLTLPNNFMHDLESKDSGLAAYIGKFLQKKGFLYHIEYELISKKFTGHIKDVNENYTLENNSKMIVKVKGTTFNGKGDLIAPELLKIDSKTILVKLLNQEEEMSVALKGLSSLSEFENKTSYSSSSLLDNLYISFKKTDTPKEHIDISKIHATVSSSTENEKAKIKTKLSFDTMNATIKAMDINASNINYDFGVSQMDKNAFNALRKVVSKAKNIEDNSLNSAIKEKVFALLSKGIKINITDLSAKSIMLGNDDLQGFTIESEINLKEDRNLAMKMMFSPLLLLGNVDFDFKSKVSKKIFDAVISSSPLLSVLDTHTKTKKDEMELDISYKKGNLKVNGKTILGK